VEFEPMEDFERELSQALERRPAPPSLKRRLMERRQGRQTQRSKTRSVVWQRLAACLVLAVVLGGAYQWRRVEERRKGEAARAQVLTALRITGHALDEMNLRLAARGR
jgi:hypothetical protein